MKVLYNLTEASDWSFDSFIDFVLHLSANIFCPSWFLKGPEKWQVLDIIY